MTNIDDAENRRPLGLVLLAGLYFFFFLVSASTFSNPFPFFGRIYLGTPAKFLVFWDSLACLYLFIGIMKRQYLTWYLLIGYNLVQVGNTIINLTWIPVTEIERVIGRQVDQQGLFANNVAAALAILLVTQFVYRHKGYFSSRQKYLF